MSKNSFIQLGGSKRQAPQNKRIKVTPQTKTMRLHLRINDSNSTLPRLAAAVKNGEMTPLSAEQLSVLLSHACQSAVGKVSKAVSEAGFSVGNFDPHTGLLPVEGSARLVRQHFGATLNEYLDERGNAFTGRKGVLSLPSEWDISDEVAAVHGIDQRPKLQPRYIDAGVIGVQPRQSMARSWNAKAAADHYGVPQNKLGGGWSVGFVSLGGGLDPKVCERANARLGLSAPKITIITVDGASNSPSGSMDGADGENYLDSQVQAAVAPLADQIMAIGPNTVTGFANALLALAKHERKPRKISISWGAREDGEWTDSDRDLFDRALQVCMAMGINVFCAAGDDGSSDGAKDGKAHCDYPASSPWNCACSGVYDNGSVVKAWNATFGGATGGGVSLKYPQYTAEQLLLQKAGVKLPVHADTGKPGRVVGDIAGIADPATGIEVMAPNGSIHVIGGTSAVSPFHAAAGVCLDSELGKATPDFNATLYKLAADGKNVCMPVTKGSNGAYNCNDGDVFNAVCGLGPIDYKKFFAALK
ncbi:MAG: hypothetical protein K2X27_14750 [Candidatus Obscuribacterales bacterium]|nr:hypothetical protein [Candidatus Obscuribacterales bacterium]